MARSATSTHRRRAPAKGATQRRAPRKQARTGIPGWLWGLAGLIAGFALSEYFQQSAPPVATVMPKPPSAVSQPADTTSPPSQQAQTSEPRMPTFEFYTLLPESEVIAPKVENIEEAPSTDAVVDIVEEDSAVQASQQPSQQQGSFMLQAASFKEVADAKRLAGRLQDFGLVAKISEVQATGNQTWHRVQVGPYQDTRELNRAQDLMITQGIEPLLIRLQN